MFNKSTLNKARIISKCINGDRKAQNTFYEYYKNKFMGICLRYAKNEDEAKDIFQEAFIKLFNTLDRVKEPDAIDFYIRNTIVRTAINHYHKKSRQMAQDIDECTDEVDNTHYEEIIDKLSNEELVLLINELPDGYRVVFNLYIMEGFKHKEIAEMLGISVNTSKSQLKSAKSCLKARLMALGIKHYERV